MMEKSLFVNFLGPAKLKAACVSEVMKGGMMATALVEVTLTKVVLTPLILTVPLLLSPFPVRMKEPPL